MSTPTQPSFDPRRVGALECRAWVAYYRREWLPFLRAAIMLARHTFGLPWPATLRGAYLVLRANQLWAPYPDNDPEGARRLMERFYRSVREAHGGSFDTVRASELEVEWWRIHREHQRAGEGGSPGGGISAESRRPAESERPLIEALAALYAHVYNVPVEEVRLAATERSLAMRYSDRWVREGCDRESPLLEHERTALVRSYAALLAAVHLPRAPLPPPLRAGPEPSAEPSLARTLRR